MFQLFPLWRGFILIPSMDYVICSLWRGYTIFVVFCITMIIGSCSLVLEVDLMSFQRGYTIFVVFCITMIIGSCSLVLEVDLMSFQRGYHVLLYSLFFLINSPLFSSYIIINFNQQQQHQCYFLSNNQSLIFIAVLPRAFAYLNI